jgi:hypothetical protein
MRLQVRSFWWLVALGLLGACDGGDAATAGAAGGGEPATGGTSAVATGTGGSGAAGWDVLIEGDWSLPVGSEGYTCVVATVPGDLYIGAFLPIAPIGTHHTVLTQGAQYPDGVFPCDAATNGHNMIYGSGVGTEADVMPEGLAVRLSAGDKILLNLHLFNATGAPLSGTSGVAVKRLDPADVVHEATSVLAGTFTIDIPPQSAGTAIGHCTVPSPVTIFSVGPHMHQLGRHMKVTSLRDGRVVHDAPYSFEDQRHFMIEPFLALEAGDTVRVECEYQNPSNQSVQFGDSSNAEMCFAGLFHYPANSGLSFICAD